MVWTVQTRQIWKYNINISILRVRMKAKGTWGLYLRKYVWNFGLNRCLVDMLGRAWAEGEVKIPTLCQTMNVLLFLRGNNVTGVGDI